MRNPLAVTSLAGALLAGLVSALPSPKPLSYDLELIHQFPNLHWIENMAVRRNGQILATDVAQANIYLVDPQAPGSDPALVHSFPPGTELTGIAEVDDDVFYTQAAQGNVYNFTFAPNSSAVWQVDMRPYHSTGQAGVKKVVDIPSAKALNGMCLLDKAEGTLLLADSPAGVIYRLNTRTLEYAVVFDDPLLKPIATAHPPFGVNGVHVVDGTLYFSNTNKGLLCTVPINKDGTRKGPVKVLSDKVPAADDFAVAKDGSVWLAENVRNTLVRVLLDGTVQTVAGGQNSTQLLGPVAAVFGSGWKGGEELYVSTDGISLDPVTRKAVATNGKIVKVDTKGCQW